MEKIKKTIRTSLFSACLLGGIAAVPSVPFLTSCSKSPVETTVNVFNKKQVLSTHHFAIPFSISNNPKSPVAVQVLNDESGQISIDAQQIFLDSKNGEINFSIDPIVDESSHFHFDVEFLFINSLNNYQKLIVDDFDIYYLFDPVNPVDDVESPNRSITQTNDWNFFFRIQFYKNPQNSRAFVELESDESGAIEFDHNWFFTQQVPEHSIYYFDVPVKLALSECRTGGHRFSLSVRFVNSFGVEQTTIISGFNAYLLVNPTEVVPSDYYNVVSEFIGGKEHFVLLGLKKEISREEAGRYSRMILPDNVTDISPGAFIDNKWFGEIDYIKIGANTQSIGESALAGCTQAFELDLSSNINCDSTWFNEDFSLFNGLKYEAGFVWFDDSFDEERTQKAMDKLKTKGIPVNWDSDKASRIIPDDFYIYDDQDPTKLIGIVEEKVYQLFKYSVIRLPKKTKIIAENSLNELSAHPFNPSGTEEGIAPRFFLINVNVTELHCMPKGVTGHITFRCFGLEKLDDGICQQISDYPRFPWLAYNWIQLDLQWLQRLTEIGNNAFSDMKINGEIRIPSLVTKVGDVIISRSQVSKLVLTTDVADLGNGAFSCPYLQEIDLSIYKTIPDWLSLELNLFDTLYNARYDAIIYINKNASDDELDEWKENLFHKQRAPIEGVMESTTDHYWKVVRRSY